MLHNLFATKNQHNFNSLLTFQVIWKTSAKLGLLDKDMGGYLGGGKINCSKNVFFGVPRAQRAFGARQVFETTFGHIENFWV